MYEINYDAACHLFNTQVTLQYQNRLKLQDTIEEHHGLRGTHLNVLVPNLLQMKPSSFAPTDVAITPLNETNV
ncbi:MAG: hypothetical protein REH83_07345 [Rickettsiella sp.]|nr:hypothetical protein [Rickettsiella sp.]